MEVSYSQNMEMLILRKIWHYARKCNDAQIIIIINICKSQPHRKLQWESKLVKKMVEKELLTLDEWLDESDNPAFGPVLSLVLH